MERMLWLAMWDVIAILNYHRIRRRAIKNDDFDMEMPWLIIHGLWIMWNTGAIIKVGYDLFK